MNIGIIIGRIGGVDGVALETEKWITVLERLGHRVFLITGEQQLQREHITLLPELSFDHPQTLHEQEHAFFQDTLSENAFLQRLEQESEYIAKNILDWVAKNGIEVLVSQNASALPCHLAMGVAIKKVLADTAMPAVCHHHDFYWERGERYDTHYPALAQLISECFPPQLDNVRHVVINSYNRDQLREKFAIEATIVPNVMDFSRPYGCHDAYNASLLADLQLTPENILLFQITRIVRRKGIETAIRLLKELDMENARLVIAGNSHDDRHDLYYRELVALVKKWQLEERVLFAGNHFANNRRYSAGNKLYSLEDAYAYATACTYFSTYEGFGNAFVEAVLAKKPIFVNNYQPVYWSDIGSLGFRTVMIENGELTDDAVTKIKEILYDKRLQREIAEHNFTLGKQHFSFSVIEKLLEKLFCF